MSAFRHHDDEEAGGPCGSHGPRFAPFGQGPHGRKFHHHHGPHGFGPFGRAKRGNVRAAVLAVLADEPMHGYQIMQKLEELSGGIWRPSPGSVYPTLQLLEDQGLVKSEEIEGRRVFSLTEEGKAEAEAVKERGAGAPWLGGNEPRFKLRQAFFQLGAATKQIGMSGTPEQIDEVLKVLAEARKRIYTMLAESE